MDSTPTERIALLALASLATGIGIVVFRGRGHTGGFGRWAGRWVPRVVGFALIGAGAGGFAALWVFGRLGPHL